MSKYNLLTKTIITASFLFILASPTFAVAPLRNQTPTISGKMRSCQARQSGVKTRMTQLTQLISTMETTFDKIADRVKNYYTTKVLPTKTVSNYDALVNDIAAKRDLVTTALNKTKTDITNFDCTTGNPVTLMNQFRIDMQSVKSALKNYRTSIRNLIVAVNKVVGGEESGEKQEPSETPEPTKTPTPTPSTSM